MERPGSCLPKPLCRQTDKHTAHRTRACPGNEIEVPSAQMGGKWGERSEGVCREREEGKGRRMFQMEGAWSGD